MDDPLPIGMGLRVPLPVEAAVTQSTTFAAYSNQTFPIPEVSKDLEPGADGLVDFDELTTEQVAFKPLMRCRSLLTIKYIDEVMYC